MPLFADRQRGFSLVELSVTLMIISITLAGALDLAVNYEESDKIDTTVERRMRIERAIEDFVFTEKRLPCPASLTLRVDEENFGVGGVPDTADTPDCPNLTPSFFSTDVYGGAVPIRDLGLSDDFLVDAWGRRFLYAVDKVYIHNETTNAGCAGDECFFHATEGELEIQSTELTGKANEVAYVIVSYGNNGLGGFNTFGAKGTSTGRLPDPDALHIAEVENAEPPAGGAGFDGVFVEDDKSATFDDIVAYRTKSLISTNAKGISEWSTCEAAEDAVTTCADIPDPPSSPVGSGDDACIAMAEAIYRFCIDYGGE